MAEPTIIRLSQQQEQSATSVRRSGLSYRYAYARSADSRQADDTGQDYLVIQENGTRLAFALCDGVSQSFMGNLAARLLGDNLVAWLWAHQPAGSDLALVQRDLVAFLHGLSGKASPSIHTFELPGALSPLVREVLEHKRTLGSESTFAAGLLDTLSDRLFLVWMGDSRIRFWGHQTERTAELGATFHTSERWSTHRGLVGQLHLFACSLQNVQWIAAYSDGIAELDSQLQRPLATQTLDQLIAAAAETPESDDISILEIRLSAAFPATDGGLPPASSPDAVIAQQQPVAPPRRTGSADRPGRPAPMPDHQDTAAQRVPGARRPLSGRVASLLHRSPLSSIGMLITVLMGVGVLWAVLVAGPDDGAPPPVPQTEIPAIGVPATEQRLDPTRTLTPAVTGTPIITATGTTAPSAPIPSETVPPDTVSRDAAGCRFHRLSVMACR